MNRDLWDKAAVFHGHECPGLAIGVRASEVVVSMLGIGRSSDEEIVCVTENDACGADAIQAILGCTFGKGNLIYMGTGKMAFSFFCRESGKKLRIYFKGIMKSGMDRAAYQQYILDAPADEIFNFSEPVLDVPKAAEIFKSVVCEKCGERASEHKIRLQEGKAVCLDCFDDYERGWRDALWLR
jgi:formylmethanofuran dehydrogenase subunit E